MPERFQTRKFGADLVDDAAQLLARRHRKNRESWPALDPKFEDPQNCAPLINERLEQDGAVGAAALGGDGLAGYVLMTPKADDTWGPNAWAEDVGSAGDPEAVRVAYAAAAGKLVDAGIRGHWAMVPASD